jgi:hypothetical protein
MSRSAFAARFTELARQLGYDSGTAFARACTRVAGTKPGATRVEVRSPGE